MSRPLDELVEAVEHDRRVAALPGVAHEHRPELAHRRRRRHVVPHDVADGDADRPVRQAEQVVPVTADLGRRRPGQVTGGAVEPGHGGQLRQQAALQLLGDVVLALVEPRVVDGEGSAPGEVGRGREVVVVVGAAGAVGEQRQDAEHLAPGPQRHDEGVPHAQGAVHLEELRLADAVEQRLLVDLDPHRRSARQHPRGPRAVAQAGRLQLLEAAQQRLLVRIAVPGGDPLHAPVAGEQVHRAAVGHERHDQAGQPVERLVDVQRRGQHRRRLGQQGQAALGLLGRGPGGALGHEVALALVLSGDAGGHVGLDADVVGHLAAGVEHR
jgi:hypothetical protein